MKTQMRSRLLVRTGCAACLIALGVAAGYAQAQAVKFAPRGDYDLLIRQSVTQAPGSTARRAKAFPGQPETTYRLERFHQGWMRMDGMLDENGKPLKDAPAAITGYLLVNNDRKIGFNVTGTGPQQKVEKLPMDMAAAAEVAREFTPKPTGETLTIAGETCNVLTVDIAGTVARTCVTPDGLTLRMEMQAGPNTILHEAVKLNRRTQNAADFTPPAVP